MTQLSFEAQLELARARNKLRLGGVPKLQAKEILESVKDRLSAVLNKAKVVELNGKEYRRVSLSESARRLISPDGYYAILEKQNGVCAICKTECSQGKMLAVDHCHELGHVRGLLCAACNMGLGMFKDRIDLFAKAIEYLIENEKCRISA